MLYSKQSQYLSNIYFCSLYFWGFSCGAHHHTQSSFTRCLSVPHRSQQIKANWRHAWCIASLSATDKIVIICVQTDFVTCRKSRWHHWYERSLPLALPVYTVSVHALTLTTLHQCHIRRGVSGYLTVYRQQWRNSSGSERWQMSFRDPSHLLS